MWEKSSKTEPQVYSRNRDTERRLRMPIISDLCSVGLWFEFRLGDWVSGLRTVSIFFISFKLGRNRFSPYLLEFIIHWESHHKKLRGFSPQAKYTDRATAACRRS
jgi:hypothetical protein